jgi:hypothetical protein
MPRTDFGPEVKASMQGNANSSPRAQVPPRPRSPGQQAAIEGRDSSGNSGEPPPGPKLGVPGARASVPTMRPPGGAGMPPHVGAAAGIAHAILANRGLR